MVKVDLKGIAKVKAKGRTYYYAWRGGPRLRGEPGSPEFIASYNEAVAQLRALDENRFRFVVADYKKLADSTRDQWGKWLDRIALYFGELRIAQFDRPAKIRPVIRRWRGQWAETPRTADYGMQCCPVCSPTPSNSAASPAIPARASSTSTTTTGRKLSGPMRT